ncbi:MAG: rhomboid family intramembrane serine protease [bacterium]
MTTRTQRGSMQLGPQSTPPVVRVLLIINGIVWGLQLLNMFVRIFPMEHYLGLVPLWAAKYGFLWQFITYQFLHSPVFIFHILFNMLMLWMFGSELERQWGGAGFLQFYLICGIGAGGVQVATSLMAGTGTKPTIGASGAILGLLGAFAMMWPDRMLYFFGLIPIRAKWAVFGIALISLYFGIQPGKGMVAHMAHLGGLLTGVLYVWKLNPRWSIWDSIRRGLKKREREKKKQQWEQQQQKREEMQEEADRILDKMQEVGWGNLTEEEQQRIQEISRKLKDLDRF